MQDIQTATDEKIATAENKPNVSFSRDSSTTLGMTGCERRQRIKNKKRAYKSINGTYAKVFCHVEQAKRRRNISRKRCLNNGTI